MLTIRPEQRAGLRGQTPARQWGVPLLLLATVVVVRAQTFGNPVLGFDEQFYLLVGDRMLHGAVPFVDIFDRKPIGLFLIYAFIRLLGGEGTIEYQLVAGLFVWGTALVVWRFGRPLSGERGAVFSALAYIVWLDFLEGEGGQAPVFFNLPMAVAALLTNRVVVRRSATVRAGLLPMLLVGIAIQIKYTALFEGIFFGCLLLFAARRASPGRIVVMALSWIGVALAPTVVAYLAYVEMGEGRAFVFANFVSMWGKLPDPLATSASGLLIIGAVLSPLFAAALLGRRQVAEAQRPTHVFVLQWLLAALAGMLAMQSFSTPQYAMPVLVPAAIAAAPALGTKSTRPVRLAVLVASLIALIASQLVLWSLQNLKGRAGEARLMAAAAMPRNGCLLVYDGYPALYRLTNSCLLSRFAFPGHLNMTNEGSARALGVAPDSELRRILALRPDKIVLDDPPFERVNIVTYRIVRAELSRRYELSFVLRTGDRWRLVYRRKR